MVSLKDQPAIVESLSGFCKVVEEGAATIDNWFGVQKEMLYAVKFFLLRPEYREPLKMQSRHPTA
jgi:hypothetical protein